MVPDLPSERKGPSRSWTIRIPTPPPYVRPLTWTRSRYSTSTLREVDGRSGEWRVWGCDVDWDVGGYGLGNVHCHGWLPEEVPGVTWWTRLGSLPSVSPKVLLSYYLLPINKGNRSPPRERGYPPWNKDNSKIVTLILGTSSTQNPRTLRTNKPGILDT